MDIIYLSREQLVYLFDLEDSSRVILASRSDFEDTIIHNSLVSLKRIVTKCKKITLTSCFLIDFLWVCA